jgi:hypothetical protein
MSVVSGPLYGDPKLPLPVIPKVEKGMQNNSSKKNSIFFIPPGFYIHFKT